MEKDEIGPNLVRKISYLARLGLSEDEVEKLTEHFKRVLEYVKMLDELPSIGGDIVSGFVIKAPLRNDVVGESLDREDALRNAPQTNGKYIIIPRVITKEE